MAHFGVALHKIILTVQISTARHILFGRLELHSSVLVLLKLDLNFKVN